MDWQMGYEGAEIQAWAESAASIYWWPLFAWVAGAVVLLFFAVLVTGFPVRRRFWCEQAGREVDVDLEEHGAPGLRRFIAVRPCSAFEPSTAVMCRRSCLHRGAAGGAPVGPETPRSG